MWSTDIVSDLHIAPRNDLDSCKQHCNQCPICSRVPLVWMPFCHFFHPLPSGCLRTSNPEKRAHLPKEERSKEKMKKQSRFLGVEGKLGWGKKFYEYWMNLRHRRRPEMILRIIKKKKKQIYFIIYCININYNLSK